LFGASYARGLLYLAYLSSGEYLAGAAISVTAPQSGHLASIVYLEQAVHLNNRFLAIYVPPPYFLDISRLLVKLPCLPIVSSIF
jgi:hypothetical protein